MALIKCKECGQEMSDQAISCPKCGYIKPKTSTEDQAKGCIFLLVILIIGYFGCKSCESDSSQSVSQTKPEIPKTTNDLIQEQFSAWDGSHRKLKELIKATMNDPKSFDHVKSGYVENTDGTISVYTTFRGKNVFGGVVTKSASAKFTIMGEFVELIEWFE